LIEKADFPLLVIPYQVRYQPYKLIAFATDMTAADPGALAFLRNLSQYSDAEILITHVSNSQASAREEELALARFFEPAPSIPALPELRYQAIKDSNVNAALKELASDAAIDLLVLTKKDHNFFQKVFEKSVIKALTRHPAKPVLIFPVCYMPEPLSL
jgi:nucleotide-binding universal stress UspA family protein